MYSVSIYVSDIKVRDLLTKIVRCYFSAKGLHVSVKNYPDLPALQQTREMPEIVFLDVDSDTEAAKQIAYAILKKNPSVYLVVLSDKYNSLDDAMDMKAFRYLGKNLDIKRIFSAFDIIVSRKHEITFISNYIGVRLALSDIVCIYSKDRKTTVLTASGVKYITTITIKEWLCRLRESKGFIHPHYSYIVNQNYITEFDGVVLTIQCKNGDKMEIFPAQRKLTEIKSLLITKLNAELYE